jgi:hypothetical protein
LNASRNGKSFVCALADEFNDDGVKQLLTTVGASVGVSAILAPLASLHRLSLAGLFSWGAWGLASSVADAYSCHDEIEDLEIELKKPQSDHDRLIREILSKVEACENKCLDAGIDVSAVAGGLAATLRVYKPGDFLKQSRLILNAIKDIRIKFKAGADQLSKKMRPEDFAEVDRKLFHSKEQDLFNIPRGTSEQASAANEAVMSDLKAWPKESSGSRRAPHLTAPQIQEVYRAVDSNGAADLYKLPNYDPKGNMGFCFGRAVAAHIEALRSGIDRAQVRKVWAVGDFKSGNVNWRYHVATVVRDASGKWIAVDPIFGGPLPLGAWYLRMKAYENPTGPQNMRLFTTNAERFGPSATDKYSPIQMGTGKNPDGVYRGFFKDMMQSFRDNPRAK